MQNAAEKDPNYLESNKAIFGFPHSVVGSKLKILSVEIDSCHFIPLNLYSWSGQNKRMVWGSE